MVPSFFSKWICAYTFFQCTCVCTQWHTSRITEKWIDERGIKIKAKGKRLMVYSSSWQTCGKCFGKRFSKVITQLLFFPFFSWKSDFKICLLLIHKIIRGFQVKEGSLWSSCCYPSVPPRTFLEAAAVVGGDAVGSHCLVVRYYCQEKTTNVVSGIPSYNGWLSAEGFSSWGVAIHKEF